ncbi:Profilin [Klebsormidium nitens]|uniref:Profilin n=1 Tax=Klebsormidium nitens TaxID=105231 RepID=A0A1Y1HM38_KLENI|nr:Profilin [Klebsormidium nitens]|eukprot:GAQ78249.1 Profilin [Klebsormidium nitens]
MSWQSYVDDHLLCQLPSGNQLRHAAIYGQDGSLWAESAEFPKILPEEIEKIVAGFADPNLLGPTGIMIAGQKYMAVMSEKDVVLRGKKGPGGCTIKKTTSALLIGIYEEPVQPGECNVVVENLGDYLIGQGY